jgi:hypothetical protein
MAFNCSISRQDCKRFPDNPWFNGSSCVPYTPWLTGDQGICGWVGAPCGSQIGNLCSTFHLVLTSAPELIRRCQTILRRTQYASVVDVGKATDAEEYLSFPEPAPLFRLGLGDSCVPFREEAASSERRPGQCNGVAIVYVSNYS